MSFHEIQGSFDYSSQDLNAPSLSDAVLYLPLCPFARLHVCMQSMYVFMYIYIYTHIYIMIHADVFFPPVGAVAVR